MSKLVSTLKQSSVPFKLNENWVWYKWGDLIENYQQGLIRSNSELSRDQGVDYFKMNFINEDGSYTFDKLPKTIASIDEIRKYKINSGDFFINVRNSYELVGKCCVIYNVDRDILYNHMLVRIAHKEYVTGYYISAFLNTNIGKKLLDTCKKGTTTVIALYQSDLYELPIPLPSPGILRNIDAIYNSLNEKIELNNRINAELEQMAETLYDYWFVQFDFPNEDGKPYKSSGGKMVYDEVLKREIPQGWANEQIGDLGTIVGGSTPSKAKQENFVQSGTPWITPKDLSMNVGNKFITKGELDVSEKGLKEASLNVLSAGSVLMSSRAPVGYLAINRVPCTTNQGFKSIICNKAYSCEYIFYVLKQYMPTIEANATGSTFKEISAGVFKSINILKPDEAIVDRFIRKVKPIFDKQENVEEQNQQLASLRDWLLPMLMNGQVTVGDVPNRSEEDSEEQVDTIGQEGTQMHLFA